MIYSSPISSRAGAVQRAGKRKGEKRESPCTIKTRTTTGKGLLLGVAPLGGSNQKRRKRGRGKDIYSINKPVELRLQVLRAKGGSLIVIP